MQKITISGKNLTIENIEQIVKSSNITVEIPEAALQKVETAHRFIESTMDKKVMYGINTGFGPMASRIINHSELVHLQYNLIRSHATGVGKPVDSSFVLAAMVVRLNTLVKGYSGVSRELITRLALFINKRIVAIVPEHGAVGTSGDLVQLAHIAVTLIGEGEVMYQGKRRPTKKILEELSIPPYILKPKEGLALINGTSMMAGIGALVCSDANRLLALAVRNGALSLELVNGFSDSIAETLHLVRPHQGQIIIARELRAILRSSHLLKDRSRFQKTVSIKDEMQKIETDVQDFYSFRCIPQILGPVFETLAKTWRVIEIEINSATDNPIVDASQKEVLHGGNFHGDYIALAMDHLKATLVKTAILAERRINFFLNENVNHRFPPFLNAKTPGLTLALQGLQFVATSITAQSQTLAFPQYVHSIPTNADNQDVVSMGADAALLTAKVLENAFYVLAIETTTLAQAVDIVHAGNKLSISSKKLFRDTRSILPAIQEDRILSKELESLTSALKNDPAIAIPWKLSKIE